MRTGTLRLLAFSRAAHTLAFLTRIQWVWKSLSVHKNTVFKEAIFEKQANKMSARLEQVHFQWDLLPGHLGQHCPGGVYELEQLRGRQGLRSHTTLPYCGEEKAVVSLKVNRSVLSLFKQRHVYLTGTDLARLVRGRKPLAVAIDAMVIGATFTQCTAGT